jgi:succinoglycan biosynthesis transport protein ExoP
MKFRFDEGIQLAEFVGIVKRRWRLVLAGFAGVLGIAVLFTWNQPEIYKATTKVMMGQTLIKALLPEQANPYESYFLEKLSFDTQPHVIKSDPVAERVVRRLRLVPPDASPDALQAATQRVKATIMVERIPETRLFMIHAIDSNPKRARDIANATAEVYIALNQERKLETTKKSIAWLTEELATLEGKVRGSEEAMIDYLHDENVDIPSGTALDTAPGGSDRASTSQASALDALNAELTAAEIELSALRQRYLDRHPRILAQQAAIRTLEEKIAQETAKSSAQNKKLIQYNIQRRESELNKDMLVLLMKKLKEMDITGGLSDNNITVVEYARIPGAPISPNKPRNLAIGAILGLLLGLGIAFYLEVFDRTVQNHEDAERYLKLPVLASLFWVKAGEKIRNPFTLTFDHPSSAESEMFRTLRTNIKFSRPDGAVGAILLTSSGPDEGKSTISSNLGITLASAMKRTVIVDADFRKPKQHRVFGLKSGPGLVEALVGEAELDAVIQPTRVKNLSVIARGSNPPNPAELLDSDRMREVVRQLRERFDLVIFDSPPVGSVSDALILAAQVDGTVLVVEAGKFEAGFVLRAKEQIEKAQGRILGVVINKTKRERLGYYYQQYYGHEPSEQESRAST